MIPFHHHRSPFPWRLLHRPSFLSLSKWNGGKDKAVVSVSSYCEVVEAYRIRWGELDNLNSWVYHTCTLLLKSTTSAYTYYWHIQPYILIFSTSWWKLQLLASHAKRCDKVSVCYFTPMWHFNSTYPNSISLQMGGDFLSNLPQSFKLYSFLKTSWKKNKMENLKLKTIAQRLRVN